MPAGGVGVAPGAPGARRAGVAVGDAAVGDAAAPSLPSSMNEMSCVSAPTRAASKCGRGDATSSCSALGASSPGAFAAAASPAAAGGAGKRETHSCCEGLSSSAARLHSERARGGAAAPSAAASALPLASSPSRGARSPPPPRSARDGKRTASASRVLGAGASGAFLGCTKFQ